MNRKKYLIVDWSPVAYGNLFGASVLVKKDKRYQISQDDDGKYNLDEYKDIVVFKIIDELANLRTQFNLSDTDEIIIATDTPGPDGLWRKDIWKGYKAKRGKARDDSNIQWDKAFDLFKDMLDVLDKCSSFKVIRTPRTEGDDIIFVITQYLALEGNEIIIHSSDHDFKQLLIYDNVKFWRTTRSQGMEKSKFYEATPEELTEVIAEHCISGDPGDGFGHIKQYSRFSPDFLKHYPHMKGKEKEVYPKRFEVEQMYKEKYGEDAEVYSHPRFGYKTFLRSKKTLDELLSENEIYKWNYELNTKLALPEHIPSEISSQIIQDFKSAPNKRDAGCLTKFFTDYGMFELVGEVSKL
jgi:hypothetical protein